jgi:transcriptional regulator with XRE-family HTH domain
MKDYNKAIKITRIVNQLTQAEFASRLKVDQTLVSRIEKGERNPTDEFIDKVKTKFNISSELFDFLALVDTSRIPAKKLDKMGRYLLEILASTNEKP